MAIPYPGIEAKVLTSFAVEMRYPNPEEVTDQDIDDAIWIAEAVLVWATPLVPVPKAQP